MLNKIQASKVMHPRIQCSAEPKVSLPLPPPNDEAPTDKSEKPMAVTTLAATTGVISLIQYFAKSQRVPSMIPPTKTAPIMAP